MTPKNILVLDVESSIMAKGNPFHQDNKLVMVGLKDALAADCYHIEYKDAMYGKVLPEIKARIEGSDLLIGFNLKFDLHWIRRYIPDIVFPAVWDCQLAEFILSNQAWAYPGLDESLQKRGLPGKVDGGDIDQYWNAGISTEFIPEEKLTSYLKGDLTGTEALFYSQEPLLRNNKIFKLHCQDLLVLQEMEYNGLKYDLDKNKRLMDVAQTNQEKLHVKLTELTGHSTINWGSSQQVSAYLFGGYLSNTGVEEYVRVLKDGTESKKTRKCIIKNKLPRLVNPLKNIESKQTAKMSDYELETQKVARVYSVSEDVLRQLKATGVARQVINVLLDLHKLDKMINTYYVGVPLTMMQMGWKDNEVHGQLNQCRAVTGRLSSSNPNLQNFTREVHTIFRSQYE